MENVHFSKKLTALREWLPTLSFVIITIVYLTSAVVEAISINREIDLLWLSVLIGLSLQAVRAIVVFFGQLNPEKPDFGWSREIIAACLAGFSVYSVWGLASLNGWSAPVTFSLCLLMIVGAIVEIMILREIKSATVQELMNNPEAMKRLQNGAIKRAHYKQFSKRIRDVESGKIDAAKADFTTVQENELIGKMKGRIAELEQKQDWLIAANEEWESKANSARHEKERAIKDLEGYKLQLSSAVDQVRNFKSLSESRLENYKELKEENARLRLALDLKGKSEEAAAIPTASDGPPSPTPKKPEPKPEPEFDEVKEGERIPAGSSFDFDF